MTAITALAMAIADLIQAAIRVTAPRVGPLDFAIAGLHLFALYAVAGVTIGMLMGGLLVTVRRVPSVADSLARMSSREFWLRPDPTGVASWVASVIVAGLLVTSVAVGHMSFVTRFHRADLAGYLLGAVTLAIVVMLAWARAWLTNLLRSWIAILGKLGTYAAFAALVLVATVTMTALFLVAHPEILLAYDPIALAWIPSSLVAWLLVAMLIGPRIRRLRSWSLRASAAVLVVLALGGCFASAITFGESNRVRSVVEQRSVIGRRMIRALSQLTDRDGDHYSWAFGGGDCDDTNPSIHPGAIDEEGDGIDLDCFGGDGAPVIIQRGRGAFGAVPRGLERPNVLVVTIDALRRDHLGAYGYERPTSPNIDRFAAQSVHFASVVPQSSRSMRSIPAMWTGNFPSEIAYGPQYLWPSLLPENVTASELIRDRAGYQTSVIMATNYFERMSDFFQGFERVTQFEVPDPPRDRAVNQALPELQRLAGSDSPWLLWVHLYNCHVPYLQDGVPSQFGSEQADHYDTEIIFADQQFQRLLDGLEELGLRDRTVVVLASDHGEGFGEHGTFGHSTTLYEEELRSVLMMRIPGVPPRRIDGLVGLHDVAPTILNLAGVEPIDDVSGISLLPFATGEREPDPGRSVFAELMPDGLTPYDIKVMRRGNHKLMWWVRDGTYQYFELAEDPGELHDLSDVRSDDARAMLGELRAWVARASRAENRTDTFVDQNRLRVVPPDITHPIEIRYPGMFTIVGFDLPKSRFQRGETIPLTFYYRVDNAIDRDLFFYVDITGPPGVDIPAHFHAWHYPLHSRYPTTRWRVGEVIRDPTPIVIPEALEAPVRLHLSLRVRDGSQLIEGERAGRHDTSWSLADFEVVLEGASPAPTR